MKQSWLIAFAIVLSAGMLSLAVAQNQLFPWSLGGQGLATSVAACPAPAANAFFFCPVAGVGPMYSLNGSPYATLVGPAGANGTNGTNGAPGPAGPQGPPGPASSFTGLGCSTSNVGNSGLQASGCTETP